MSPVGAIFVPFPPKRGHICYIPPPPPQSLNGLPQLADVVPRGQRPCSSNQQGKFYPKSLGYPVGTCRPAAGRGSRKGFTVHGQDHVGVRAKLSRSLSQSVAVDYLHLKTHVVWAKHDLNTGKYGRGFCTGAPTSPRGTCTSARVDVPARKSSFVSKQFCTAHISHSGLFSSLRQSSPRHLWVRTCFGPFGTA